MSRTKAIFVESLDYSYISDFLRIKVEVLKNVSFEVFEGEAFGFLGHNGAGKTTTIKCLLNLIKPRSGKIKIFDLDSKLTEARTSLGYLAELPYYYDNLTVYETMEFYATLSGIKGAQRKTKIEEVLERMNIASRSKDQLKSLSKGLTQRLGMAQAIISHPKLLILDEPFSGLDPIGRKEFRELLLDLKSKGTTIFICSHILSDIEMLCDRFSIMSKGEIKGVFSKDDTKLSSLEDLFVSLINEAGEGV